MNFVQPHEQESRIISSFNASSSPLSAAIIFLLLSARCICPMSSHVMLGVLWRAMRVCNGYLEQMTALSEHCILRY